MNSPVSASPPSSDSVLPSDEDRIEKLARRLREETAAALERRNPGAVISDSLNRDVVSIAYRQKHIGLLNAMLRNASESDNPLTEVLSTYNILIRNNVPEPDLHLTPDSIALKVRVHKAMVGLVVKKHQVRDRTRLLEAMCSYAVTAAPEDQPLIEHLVIQRGMTLPDEVSAMVPEMKNGAYALGHGSL